MGYRSDVRIVVSQKGYREMEKFLERYIIKKNLARDVIFDFFYNTDVVNENKYEKYFGWNDVKWDQGFDESDSVDAALKYLKESGYSYNFSRIGEDYFDMVEHGCTGPLDAKNYIYVDYPFIERKFADKDMTRELEKQTKFIAEKLGEIQDKKNDYER